MKLIKWKVQEKPSGKFGCFEKRSWPEAEYPDGSPAFSISCNTSYSAEAVKSGKHEELSVFVMDYRNQPGIKWRSITSKFKTLAEAKEYCESFIIKNIVLRPFEFRNNKKEES